MSNHHLTFLHACFDLDLESVQKLAKPENINSSDEYGRNALHCVIGGLSNEIKKFQTGKDNSRLSVSNPNSTAPSLVHFLISRGLDIDAYCTYNISGTGGSNWKLTPVSLENSNPSNLWNGKFTPLMTSIITGHMELSIHLIKAGADVFIREPQSLKTALHFAAAKGNHELIKMLIEAKADDTAKDKDGKTPYQNAIDNGYALPDFFGETVSNGSDLSTEDLMKAFIDDLKLDDYMADNRISVNSALEEIATENRKPLGSLYVFDNREFLCIDALSLIKKTVENIFTRIASIADEKIQMTIRQDYLLDDELKYIPAHHIYSGKLNGFKKVFFIIIGDNHFPGDIEKIIFKQIIHDEVIRNGILTECNVEFKKITPFKFTNLIGENKFESFLDLNIDIKTSLNKNIMYIDLLLPARDYEFLNKTYIMNLLDEIQSLSQNLSKTSAQTLTVKIGSFCLTAEDKSRFSNGEYIQTGIDINQGGIVCLNDSPKFGAELIKASFHEESWTMAYEEASYDMKGIRVVDFFDDASVNDTNNFVLYLPGIRKADKETLDFFDKCIRSNSGAMIQFYRSLQGLSLLKTPAGIYIPVMTVASTTEDGLFIRKLNWQ
jgi:ankyrin repeat protein